MVHRSVKDDDRDGSVPVLEMRSGGPAGPVTHSYCWGMDRFGRPAVNTALASFNGAGALEYYFLCDDLGTELALTDGFGNVLERYDYDDYGAPHFLTSDGIATSATNSAFENPFLFHGMQWDAETGFYCKMSGENPLYESPRDGRYVLRAGMPLRPGANAYSFDNDNPWSACSKTKTQGDFNLAHRFSVEIDGVLVAGVSEPPTITDCDDNDPKRHHPTSIARPLRLGFGILVVSGSNDRVTSSPYRTRELTGHVTLIK
jgi:hypothetical protein